MRRQSRGLRETFNREAEGAGVGAKLSKKVLEVRKKSQCA